MRMIKDIEEIRMGQNPIFLNENAVFETNSEFCYLDLRHFEICAILQQIGIMFQSSCEPFLSRSM